MRREQATSGRREQRRPQDGTRRIWRVFEYRRPVPARRVRFTI